MGNVVEVVIDEALVSAAAVAVVRKDGAEAIALASLHVVYAVSDEVAACMSFP